MPQKWSRISVFAHPVLCVHAAIVCQSIASKNTLDDGVGDMTKEVKIVIASAIGLGLLLAFNSIQTEYARITSRVEQTQVRIDAVADESKAAIADIRKVIETMQQWLTKIAMQQESGESQEAGLASDTSPVIATAPTILMHSSPTCGPCLKWKNNELERWTKAGWQVAVIDEENCERAKWPWYEITDRDGSQFEVIGPLSKDNFKAAKARAK